MTSCQKNVLPSGYEDKKNNTSCHRNIYNRSKEANDEAPSVIGREILQLCQGARLLKYLMYLVYSVNNKVAYDCTIFLINMSCFIF